MRRANARLSFCLLLFITAAMRATFSVARISPGWSTCQDLLAQMNLVLSMLSDRLPEACDYLSDNLVWNTIVHQ